MDLTAKNVHFLFLDCLFLEGELPSDGTPPQNAVTAEGVMNRYGFHEGRLKGHRDDVISLLSQLPAPFHKEESGGSFLGACMTRGAVINGQQSGERQWGEQMDVEELLCLGLALDLVEYCMPRSMWRFLPGGVPTFAVKPHP